MKKRQHLFLIDGSGYIFRAYYALPALTRKSDQLPIGAVAGFCNMIWKLLCELAERQNGDEATHIAVIFDHSSKTFRKALYPEYKATRRLPPEDLIPQFALIREATKAFHLPSIEMEGYEADDLIASYAEKAEKQGMKVTILSSDKDLMQLVNDNIQLYDTMKDCKITSKEVFEKWGVLPEKMQDLQALTGDTSDNIPGVPGIGPKTAATLLQQFGSLDQLLENLDQIPQPKRRQALIDNRANIALARQLVCLKTDVPLQESIEEFLLKPIDSQKLIAFLKAMEFYQLTQKVAKKLMIDPTIIKQDEQYQAQNENDKQEIQQQENYEPLSVDQKSKQKIENRIASLIIKTQKQYQIYQKQNQILIEDEDLLKSWAGEVEKQGFFAYHFDIDRSGKQQKTLGVALALNEEKIGYIAFDQENIKEQSLFAIDKEQMQNGLKKANFLKYFLPIFQNSAICKIGYDIKNDMAIIAQLFGRDSFDKQQSLIQNFDDILLLSYVLHNGQLNHDIAFLVQHYFGFDRLNDKGILKELERVTKDKTENYFEQRRQYCQQETFFLLALIKIFRVALVKHQANFIYYQLDKPLLPILYKMEQEGVRIDLKKLEDLSQQFKKRTKILEQDIYALAGQEFNIGSPKQLAEILFEKLHLNSAKKTKTKQMSTSSDVLENLALEGYEIAQKLLDWRQMTKMITTYSDALPKFTDKNQRVHTTYSPATTMTGRLASSAPNLQNIPIRTEEGALIRSAIIAKQDHSLVSLDYSQIELRLLAHIAKIEPLQEAFSKNQDIHSLTAAQILQIPLETVTNDLRRRAKTINYGIIYGMSAFGLAKQLKISAHEAKSYIDAYLKTMPGIQNYIIETKQMAQEKGYVETIFKRKIYYPDINAKKAVLRALAERAAINAPLQGSAADIMRRAMVRIDAYLKEKGFENQVKMLMQVHDELVFEIQNEMVDKVVGPLKNIMAKAPEPLVRIWPKLELDVKIGSNWQYKAL